jgi:3',5'-cyclic-AMP phosphodiesterase
MSPVVNASAATFPAATAPAENAPAVTIVQLTDTHLFADGGGQLRGCHTNVTFRRVVARVAQMQPLPDLLLLTGDLAQDDSLGAYGGLRDALVPLGLPVYWVPGNHDQNLGAIEAVLGPVSLFSSPLSFRAGGWHVVLLWTMVPNQVQGRVADDRLAALERSLQEDRAGLPTLVALHHPLLPIGSAVMDAIGVENAAAVLAVLGRFPQVKLVLNGHIHQEFDQVRSGIRFLGSPSTCVQLLPGSPTAVWTDEPPGFRLLRLFADGRIETEIHYLNS